MFNKKLKLEIKQLKKELSEKETEIKTLRFQVDNPPKYKVGDKVGEFIIIEKKFWQSNVQNLITDGILTIAICLEYYRSKKVSDEIKNVYAKKISNQWEYEVVNVITGKKSKKKEFELTINEGGK